MKKALIVGSDGQDGTLLKQLLFEKGYSVWGLGRRKKPDMSCLQGYLKVDLEQSSYPHLVEFFSHEIPDEVYYLAAFHQSSQEEDIEFKAGVLNRSVQINQTAFINILEIVKSFSPKARIFYASSSLIFSGSANPIQNEGTHPEPRSLYAITKIAAAFAGRFYVAEHGLFVSIGIMYNHESIFRQDHFLSKKIVKQSRQLLNGEINSITVGDLSAVTDWGYAPDYVEAMWHILQLDKPDTFVVSSGTGHRVQDWFEVLFTNIKLSWKEFVKEDKTLLIRKKPTLIGDNGKLLSTGWIPKVSFEEMVMRMFNHIL